MNIQTWLKQATKQLEAVGIKSARLDALLLIEKVLGKPRNWIHAHNDENLSELQLEVLNKNISQRASHTPIAYLIGSKEFYGRDFQVTKDVLIPRPESEDIIDLLKGVASQANLKNSGETLVILDIGTGSGIIAITAQLELPQTTVIATDISNTAIRVAKNNAHRLEAPVQFYEANLLNIPTGVKPDIILANLPYVPDALITSEEIKAEPKIALFSGKDGMNHYELFWRQSGDLDHRPSYIIIESLENQHKAMEILAKPAGYTLSETRTLIQLFTKE